MVHQKAHTHTENEKNAANINNFEFYKHFYDIYSYILHKYIGQMFKL